MTSKSLNAFDVFGVTEREMTDSDLKLLGGGYKEGVNMGRNPFTMFSWR